MLSLLKKILNSSVVKKELKERAERVIKLDRIRTIEE